MLTLTPDERREAIQLAWSLGRLNYLRRNTQRKIRAAILEARERFRKFYLESTRRLGKSSELLIGFTERCIANPQHKCGFFAPVKDGLLDYIEPLIRKTYADCPPSEYPHFDQQRFMLEFKNGSCIIFRGSNNKQHRIRRGQEFHEAGIDEARDVDDLPELIDSVIMPALFSADGYLIISSTPADTRSHPLFEIRNRAKIEGWYIGIDIWEANRLDPEAYPIDLINEWKEETLKAPDGQEIWEREYEIQWVVNRRKVVVAEWNTHTMVQEREPDPYYQFYHHYQGLDWGYKDFTAVTLATLNFRKARLEFDGELTFSGKEARSDIISERIKNLSRHLWTDKANIYRQVADSADPLMTNEINKFEGMSFIPVQKGQTLNAMVNEFRILVAQGKIIVRPACQLLIHCLENAVWVDETKRDELDQDVLAHHFDHLMSAVYLSRMVDWAANPIPADFMVDNVRIVDLNFDKAGSKARTGSGKALEHAFGRRR